MSANDGREIGMLKHKYLLVIFLIQILLLSNLWQTASAASPRQMEYLDRGIVAVKVSNGVFISWRMLGTDPEDIGFNIYRDGKKINSSLITSVTNYVDSDGTLNSKYYVCAVNGGLEQQKSETAGVLGQNYLSLPLDIPAQIDSPEKSTV
ncbi:MAG TPA: hypothetical protein VHP38_09700 [Ruminiclostridium sp.]|nr:hypothetical protein [Ruminiclostridium sp.]